MTKRKRSISIPDSTAYALTRVELDREAVCPECKAEDGVGDHGGSHLSQNCHPQAGMHVSYFPDDGSLSLQCNECFDHIATIAVAKDHAENFCVAPSRVL